MNKIIGIILTGLAISLGGANIYLNLKTDDVGGDFTVLQNIEKIYSLQKIDAAWSLAALQTLTVVESDFDKVAAFLPQFRDLRNKLSNSELTSNNVSEPLKNKLLAFLSSLEGKEHAIEEFKSNLAVTRNSAKYLPLSASVLFIRLNDKKELMQQLQILNENINAYLKDPASGNRTVLLGELTALETNPAVAPSNIGNALTNYISHASVLVERKEPMDRIITRITDDSVSIAGAELIALYKDFESTREDKRDQKNNLHNLSMLIVSVLLSIIALSAGIYILVSAFVNNKKLVKAS